jgi:hypothetical protein
MKKIMFLSLVLFAFVAIPKSSVNAQGVKIHGFMQSWLYLNQQNPSPIEGVEDAMSGLRIRRAKIGVVGDLNEVFSINAMLDFSFANTNLVDFAFIAKVSPELVFTVGQFIAPLQMYESGRLSSSSITIYEISNVSRNLSENMGFNSYRDVGIMVSGAFANMFKYYAYYGNGQGRLNFAGTNILNRKLSDGLYGLRLEVEPAKGLSIGAQYSINSQDNVNTSSGIVFRDRNSFSADIATQGFGLPFLSAILSYGMGEVKDLNYDYDGLSATLTFDITKQFQAVGRFDSYNRKPTLDGANESNYNNIVFGVNWYYFKDNAEIFKIGINYHIMNEDDNNKIDNDVLLLWTQVKF